jgi:hypothetical protein
MINLHLSVSASGVGQVGLKELTGVTVVSSQPTSITRPVILPHAARERTLAEVKETEGTYMIQLLGRARTRRKSKAYLQVLKQRLGDLILDIGWQESILDYNDLASFRIRH